MKSRLRDLDLNPSERVRDYALRLMEPPGEPIFETIFKVFSLVRSLIAFEQLGIDGASEALTIVAREIRKQAAIDHRYADERHRQYGHGLPEWWTRD